MKINYNPQLIAKDGVFQFIDNDVGVLANRKIERIFERYHSYFVDYENLKLSSKLNYVELSELIDKIQSRLDVTLEVAAEVKLFIAQNNYAIEEQRVAGITIKDYDKRWNEELDAFQQVLDQEIHRPLKNQQIQASFYLATMKRAANFSVPGSGKTAMMYGTFAYLSAPKVNQVDKIFVVSPLNAFEAWRTEFQEVFGKKRDLNYLNLKDCNDSGSIRTQWGIADVMVINYESLAGWRLSVINEMINEKTMIVFDEVHRIKNPEGKRARNALELGRNACYYYVLTGTPIPNSYKDIYNFLHLLYGNEYKTYFGWSIAELEKPNTDEINKKMQPFFWRTNKKDLNVPLADEDYIFEVTPSLEQQELVETIHEIETNILAKYIRLLQASTNPSLLTEKINLNNLGLLMEELDFNINNVMDSAELTLAKQHKYLDLGVNKMKTPKFEKGMQLVYQLVSEGKKVIVWGMFVGTMQKIHQELVESGISSQLIYGATPKDERVSLINDFRDGTTQVLISNPATLGESISLHQTVHDAIYFEYNFNLTFMLQSRDRIHRLGLSDDQYTRYYYLMTEGDTAHQSFIDGRVYSRLKEKEKIMQQAIDGNYLAPEVSDNFLEDVKNVLLGK